jgi:hypothetical protein
MCRGLPRTSSTSVSSATWLRTGLVSIWVSSLRRQAETFRAQGRYIARLLTPAQRATSAPLTRAKTNLGKTLDRGPERLFIMSQISWSPTLATVTAQATRRDRET